MNPETAPHPTREDLFAYRDGELSAERRRVIEAHVVGCRSCREAIDEISGLEALLRAAPDQVDEGYYDRLTGQTMDRVRAADTAPRMERRRSAAEVAHQETRVRPRFPWPALTAAVGAAATVIVVVGLLIRQEGVWRSAPDVAVLERSAPDAARYRADGDTTAPPPPEPVPPLGTRATPGSVPPAASGASDVANDAGKKDAASTSEDLLAKSEAEGTLTTRDEAARSGRAAEEDRLQQAGEVPARQTPMAAAPQAEIGSVSARERAAATESGYAATLRRFVLPPVWGPGVSDELVLRAEPALRNLYRTGGAATALDSARVRLYLAEAARIRLGSAPPDSATADAITHHYRRAIQLGTSDAVTQNTARARLEDFQRETAEP